VRAFVRPADAASQRVLEKAGLVRRRFVPELERYLYSRRL
jgi:[ribosomal protein S5]-alanine N-acetyltransferase